MAPLTINGNTLDPAVSPPEFFPADASNTAFIILQCKNRLSEEDYGKLYNLKVEIQRVVHESDEQTSYLCRYAPPDLRVLEQVPVVTKAVPYIPGFVAQESLKATIKDQPTAVPINVSIQLHEGTKETGKDLLQEIQRTTKAEILDSSDNQLRARVAPKDIETIAKIDIVRAIEETKTVVPRTVQAFDILKAGRPVGPRNSTYLGEGEVIAIADHGFDRGKTDDVHPAFHNRVLAIASWHSPGYQPPHENDTGLEDRAGHGTHVAGCAVGDLTSFLPGTMGDADPHHMNSIRAPAPRANLVVQAISPGENIGPNMDTLFTWQYQPGKIATIHSNSWGTRDLKSNKSVQEPYTAAESFKIDQAMSDNNELLIVWGAGNDGDLLTRLKGGPPGGTAEKLPPLQYQRQIGAEAAAKNCLTVGATYNNRAMQGMMCVDDDNTDRASGTVHSSNELAPFSSRGPTIENRLKPDVVAPGAGILSARSRLKNVNSPDMNNGKGICRNSNFMFDNGTSMAAPIVAGCVAVLREALVKNGQTHPSGALLKALVINGAVDIAGRTFDCPKLPADSKGAFGFYKVTMTPAPNVAQGFGLVDLDRSLNCFLKDGNVALDLNGLKQGETKTLNLIVPPGRPNVRITMTYTDLPGDIIQDKLQLTVIGVGKDLKPVGKPRLPDPIQPLSYHYTGWKPFGPNDQEPEAVKYTFNNAQKLTWKDIKEPQVQIRVEGVAVMRRIPQTPGETSFALTAMFTND